MDDDDLLTLGVVAIVGIGAFLYLTGRIGSPYAQNQGGLFGGGGGVLDYAEVAPGVFAPVNAAGAVIGPQTSEPPASARIVSTVSSAGLATAGVIAAPGAASAAMIAIP